MHRVMESFSHTSDSRPSSRRFANGLKCRGPLTRRVALLCCAYIASGSGFVTAAGPDNSLKQQLLAAAPDAWARWKEWTVHTESQFTEEHFRRSSPAKPVYAADFQYHLKDMTRRRHFFRILDDGRKYEEIAIRNGDRYYFTAERYDDGQLVVTEVRQGPAAKNERTVPPILEAPYTVYYRYLSDLIKNPRFVFNVSTVNGQDPSDRMRINFTYDPKGEKTPRIQQGWIELCPRQNWAVQGFVIKDPRGYCPFVGH